MGANQIHGAGLAFFLYHRLAIKIIVKSEALNWLLVYPRRH